MKYKLIYKICWYNFILFWNINKIFRYNIKDMPSQMFSTKAMRSSTASSNMRTNKNQGGGESKAGFPYMVGRISSVSLLNKINKPLTNWAITPIGSRNTKQSRPIGINPSPNAYVAR